MPIIIKAYTYGRRDAMKETAKKSPYRGKDRRTENEGYRPAQSREADENMIVGRNAVRELLASERDIDKVFVLRGEREGSIGALIAQILERKIPLVEIDRRKMDTMCGGASHQGIIAYAAARDYVSIEDILKRAETKGEKPFILIADGVEDPHNLGAIIRSAECAGVHGVIIPKRRAVGLTSVVAKTSAGAIEHMPVARVTNLTAAIEELKKGIEKTRKMFLLSPDEFSVDWRFSREEVNNGRDNESTGNMAY